MPTDNAPNTASRTIRDIWSIPAKMSDADFKKIEHRLYRDALDVNQTLSIRAEAVRQLDANDPDADDIRPNWRKLGNQAVVDLFMHDMARIGVKTPRDYDLEFAR